MSWYLDGVDLSNLAWNIKKRSAGWSVPGKSGHNITVPGRHGAFWTPNKTYDEGQLSLSMWAAGCNEDGTLPNTEDGRKKVRDNLDKLTSMFTNSRRLLNLRQSTGTELALVNELTNPTLTTDSNTGLNLATNHLLDAERLNSASREVSRNLASNPYMKGRSSDEVVVTEDLYPDPGLRRHQNDPVYNLLQSYYYPINQDIASYNQFFKGTNSFSMATGQGGRGIISIGHSPNWTGDAVIADIGGMKSNASRTAGTEFFMNIKIANGAPGASVNILTTPYTSLDGVTWTAGTGVTTTVTKSSYAWIIVPPTNLPNMGTGGGFLIQYRLRIVGASSWTTGPAFEVQHMAIQDAPEAGNPWRPDPLSPALMIVGGETPYVERYGSTGLSVSGFRRARAPWEVVNTGAKLTTAPYAYAWSGRDATRNEGWLGFSVFGGTVNTFRRVLPVPTITADDVKMWGRYWRYSDNDIVVRITRRTGTPGAYTYTTVRTFTLASSTAFVSPVFTVTAGETYCLEIDVPAGDSGLEPSIVFRELHVSNGLVNTYLPADVQAVAWGTGSRAYYTGSLYNSAIKGATFLPMGATVGIPHRSAKPTTMNGVNWANEPSGIYSRAGVVAFPTATFPTDYTPNSLTLKTTAQIAVMPHVAPLVLWPTSGTATASVVLRNGSGAVTRTVNHTLSNLTNQPQTFTFTSALNVGEVSATVSISYSDPAFPLASLLVTEHHLFLNLPLGVTAYTGNSISATSAWPRSIGWVGSPYFSQSRLTAPLSPSWDFEGFAGFDADNRTVRFTGTRVRVGTNLPAGSAYVGYRRGAHVANMTISAQPQGAASATTLGTITSTVDFVQGNVTIPANATYIDFLVTSAGAHKTLKDAFALGATRERVFPAPSTNWVGFNSTSAPSLELPTHPSSLAPQTRVIKHANGTVSLSTGDVDGWDGSVLSGGYLQVPPSGTSREVTSTPTHVVGGYVSAAVRLQPMPDAANKIAVQIQGATAAGITSGTWTTLASQTVSTTAFQEVKLVDVPAGANEWVRVVIRLINTTTPLTRTGILAIADGATLTPTPSPIGSNFPGHFVGIRAADGTSTYQGNIRQCWVEVTDAIDMQSLAYGTLAEFNVNMTVPGAFWEDVYDTKATVSAQAGTTSGSFYVSAFEGTTAPIHDIVVEVQPLSGTFSKFELKDLASGNYIRYEGPARSKVTINTSNATVRDENGVSVIKHVPATGTAALLVLSPYRHSIGEAIPNHVDGVPILEWSSDVPIKVTITGRRKYLIG